MFKLKKMQGMLAAWIVAPTIFIIVLVVILLWCDCDANCSREWLSALSGWAALIAAAPTIFLLRRQIADADRNQQTAFQIALRRHKLAAEGVIIVAQEARLFLRDGAGTLRAFAGNTTVFEKIAKALNHPRIKDFENEIATPIQMRGAVVAQLIDAALSGDQEKALAVPELADNFFLNITEQANAFLLEVRDMIAGHKPS